MLPPLITEPPPDAATRAGQSLETVEVRFTGELSDWFPIWLANLFLSVLTLGIYSAWASVRTRRWFAQHTEIAGTRFEFDGLPIDVLKSRLIGLGLLVALAVVNAVLPTVGALLYAGLFFGVLPWAIVSSLRYRARMTRYGEARFFFDGRFGGALVYCLLGPILLVLSLGLAGPWLESRRQAWLCGALSLEARRFRSDVRAAHLWPAFGRTLLVTAVVLVGFALLAWAIGSDLGDDDAGSAAGWGVAAALGFYLVPIAAVTWWWAEAQAVFWGHLALDGALRFRWHGRTGRLAWVAVGNVVATILSLGLLRPWAQIRLAREIASSMAIESQVERLALVRRRGESPAATGDGIADVFGADVAL